jgi:hypothetical protein
MIRMRMRKPAASHEVSISISIPSDIMSRTDATILSIVERRGLRWHKQKV